MTGDGKRAPGQASWAPLSRTQARLQERSIPPMRIIIRTFFRGLRLVLAPVVLIAEKLSTPKAAVERTPEQQAEVDRACESLALYQFRTCPFCVKVRKEIARLGLKDRKSTRLNSSHVRISYAVFCLKKKKKHKQ